MNSPRRAHRARPVLAVVLGILFPAVIQAQVQLTFPLGDYVKPGRYLPIQITGTTNASGKVVRLDLDNALPIEWRATASPVIVPCLIFQTPTRATCRFDKEEHPISILPLRPVSDDQALIAYSGDLDSARVIAKSLLPRNTPLWIRCDAADAASRPGHRLGIFGRHNLRHPLHRPSHFRPCLNAAGRRSNHRRTCRSASRWPPALGDGRGLPGAAPYARRPA